MSIRFRLGEGAYRGKASRVRLADGLLSRVVNLGVNVLAELLEELRSCRLPKTSHRRSRDDGPVPRVPHLAVESLSLEKDAFVVCESAIRQRVEANLLDFCQRFVAMGLRQQLGKARVVADTGSREEH